MNLAKTQHKINIQKSILYASNNQLGNEIKKTMLFKIAFRGAWVAQSVKHQTLDLGSGHDHGGEIEPRIRLYTGYGDCQRFSLFPLPQKKKKL